MTRHNWVSVVEHAIFSVSKTEDERKTHESKCVQKIHKDSRGISISSSYNLNGAFLSFQKTQEQDTSQHSRFSIFNLFLQFPVNRKDCLRHFQEKRWAKYVPNPDSK